LALDREVNAAEAARIQLAVEFLLLGGTRRVGGGARAVRAC
jgi:hypothetical protein